MREPDAYMIAPSDACWHSMWSSVHGPDGAVNDATLCPGPALEEVETRDHYDCCYVQEPKLVLLLLR